MKLASYRDGSRDGQLVVVSRDLALAHYASDIATRVQQVLDDWNFLSPQLEDLSATLNGGKARHAFAFDPGRCMAPLPRAGQWVLGTDAGPLAAPQQRASDDLSGPGEDLVLPQVQPALRLHAGVAVVTADVPRAATPAQALERVRLLLLAHAWSLPGGVQPGGTFAPLAVTPDELGAAWRDGCVHLPVHVQRQAGTGSHAWASGPGGSFGELLATIARVRPLRAGSIIGPLAPADATPADAGTGHPGAPAAAPAWEIGDTASSQATGADGLSVFGAIVQRIVLADGPPASA